MIDMDHICEDRECIYLGQRTAGVSCKCHKTREQMLEAEVVRLREALDPGPAQSPTGQPIETCLEVWNGDRKVTVYEDIVLRIWGANMETEMSETKRSHETVDAAFRWLYSTVSSTERVHDSDCSTHNAPALPVGPCDCSVSSTDRTAKNEREMAEGTRCDGLCKDGSQCNC